MSRAPAVKRVLCVEDNPDTCTLVAAVLPEFEIVSATTVAEAWQLYNEERFCLIIIDYHLEDGSGLDFCERIRKHDYLTPVVIISGDDQLTYADVRMAGAQRFITKGSVRFVDDLTAAANALHVT